ncbi:hypothetical protein K438DRAFT_2044223, partial [Mycena galopus ATCC 62051]
PRPPPPPPCWLPRSPPPCRAPYTTSSSCSVHPLTGRPRRVFFSARPSAPLYQALRSTLPRRASFSTRPSAPPPRWLPCSAPTPCERHCSSPPSQMYMRPPASTPVESPQAHTQAPPSPPLSAAPAARLRRFLPQ